MSGLYWQVADEASGEALRSRSLWDARLALPPDELNPSSVHRHLLPGPGHATLIVRERAVTFTTGGETRNLRIAVAIDSADVGAPAAHSPATRALSRPARPRPPLCLPDVSSEHDIQYNPVNNTFLTLQDYIRQIGVNTILYDRIVEVNASGDVLWTWDTYNYIPLSEASPYNETFQVNGQTVEDFTHANSLDWDYNNNVIYLNLRNTNTFYKINQTTGNIIWACGEFGNFTLLGDNGQQVSSLWYGCHDLKEVAPDVFSLFNNDYANNTNPDDCHSSLMEITLNETSMTAYVNENWEAPTQYWNSYGGSNVILPNGDMLGDFGDPSHQLPQNEPWDFNNTGAVFVEVNSTGQMVKTFTFPVGWYVYRVQALTDTTSSANVSPTASTTPNNNSSPILSIIIGALAAVIVVIVVLTIVIYRRKMRVNLKNEVTIQKSGILLFTLQFSIN